MIIHWELIENKLRNYWAFGENSMRIRIFTWLPRRSVHCTCISDRNAGAKLYCCQSASSVSSLVGNFESQGSLENCHLTRLGTGTQHSGHTHTHTHMHSARPLPLAAVMPTDPARARNHSIAFSLNSHGILIEFSINYQTNFKRFSINSHTTF